MANLPATQEKALSLRNYLFEEKIKNQFAAALPKWLSVDRLLRVVFSSVQKNPKLIDCTRESLLMSVMQCAQLGLEPILGRAYLIPYENSKHINGKWVKQLECQFQVGYQGLVDLARRSDTISDVWAFNVFEEDEFDLSYGLDRRIHHRPWFMDPEKRKKGESGEIIGAYAVWQMKDGTKHPDFMPVSDIYKRRDRSQAYQYAKSNPDKKTAQECPWIQWPEEMVIKTVLKHSSKLVPASIEFMQAVELDDDAEAGKSQLGLFAGSQEDLIELQADYTEAAEKFDEQTREEDQAALSTFLDLTAKNNKMGVDQTKAAAIENIEPFLSTFRAWAARHKPETKPGPKVDPPAETKKPENGHESGEVQYKAWCIETLEADPEGLNEALRSLNFSNIPANIAACKRVYEVYQGMKTEKL